MNPAKIKDLPIHLNTLVEFIATWFKHLKAQTYTVKISNPKDLKDTANLKDMSKKLDSLNKSVEQLSVIVSKIKIPGAPKSIDVNNFPKHPTTMDVKVINPVVDKDVQKVEVTNWKFPEIKFPDIKIPEYPKLPKFPEFKFPKSFNVDNFPKTQKVEGEVTVESFNNLLDGIQVLVDSIGDLKRELLFALTSVSTGVGNVVASTTGSHKEKVPGDVRYDPDWDTPIYTGTHQNPDASTSDDNWSITKTTYSGSAATRQVTRRGSWDGRTSLFS